jgi:alanine or glycine:cation symporter, AGCS family
MEIETALAIFAHYLTDVPEDFPWFVALLLGSGLFITLRFGFIQIRRFSHALDVVRGKYDNPDDEGDVSHFQALTVALSATVGVGNIAGVALAIHWAGPGALFWMWMTAIFGMALKYVECTLSMKYRVFDANGNASGGPMYYIEHGLGQKWAAVFFAVCAVICSFATGNMNQSNTIASVINQRGWLSSEIIGLILAILVGAVVIGGVRRIAAVTEKLLPLMAMIYFMTAVIIIFLNLDKVPGVISSIFTNAFTPEASFGGTAAGAFSMTMLYGIKRGLFSNEAGQGSAPIAHASAKTKEPVREGVVAMMGPFIDTIIICSLTALTILVTGAWNTKFEAQYQGSDVVVASSIEMGKPQRAEGQFKVKNGDLEDVILVVNHAALDQVKLVNNLGNYTGVLEVENGVITNPSKSLVIQGRGLLAGAPLTGKAFELGLSKIVSWGDEIVDLSVFLFAFSTIVGWCYYGDRSFVYLFGVRYILVYRLLYLIFVFTGAVVALDIVWAFGDIALALMAIPNLIALLFLHRQVLDDTREYFDRTHSPAD